MEDARYVDRDIGGKGRSRSADAAIAALAGRQHGVVSRAQLLTLGVGPGAMDRRLGGRLHVLHRGVYAVGHRVVSLEGRWMAAVLAAGPGAVLSHRSAAALWDLRPTDRGRVEITAPRARRTRPGLEAHRVVLAFDEATSERGIPVTTPARTLLDLAAVISRAQLERAAERVETRQLGTGPSLDELFMRYPGRPGVPTLRAIADSARLDTHTRSELEARFLAFVAEHGLPEPRANARVRAGGRRMEVDCAWPAPRVAVELDGHAHHSSRGAFERDRARDRRLQAAGWRVVRVTWRQLRDEPEAVAADLRGLLAPRALR